MAKVSLLECTDDRCLMRMTHAYNIHTLSIHVTAVMITNCIRPVQTYNCIKVSIGSNVHVCVLARWLPGWMDGLCNTTQSVLFEPGQKISLKIKHPVQVRALNIDNQRRSVKKWKP